MNVKCCILNSQPQGIHRKTGLFLCKYTILLKYEKLCYSSVVKQFQDSAYATDLESSVINNEKSVDNVRQRKPFHGNKFIWFVLASREYM